MRRFGRAPSGANASAVNTATIAGAPVAVSAPVLFASLRRGGWFVDKAEIDKWLVYRQEKISPAREEQEKIQKLTRQAIENYTAHYNKAGHKKTFLEKILPFSFIWGKKVKFPEFEEDTAQHKKKMLKRSVSTMNEDGGVKARVLIDAMTKKAKGKEHGGDLQKINSLPFAVKDLDANIPELERYIEILEQIQPSIQQAAESANGEEKYGLAEKVYKIGQSYFTAWKLDGAEDVVKKFLELRDKDMEKGLEAHEFKSYGTAALRSLLLVGKVGSFLTTGLVYKLAGGEAIEQLDKVLKKSAGGDLEQSAKDVTEIIAAMHDSVGKAKVERDEIAKTVADLREKTAKARTETLVAKFNKVGQNDKDYLAEMAMMAIHDRPDFLDRTVPGAEKLFAAVDKQSIGFAPQLLLAA